MDSKRTYVLRYAAYPLLLMLYLGQRIQAQNLVPNPSFEDVNICSEYDQPCSPSAWFYLSRKFTTGYFPRYPSATGSRHLQMVAATRETPNRQYWETMLLCPLTAGERYAVSMKVAAPANRAELSKTCPNLRDVGLWFTNRFVFVQGDSILQPRGYLSFTNASVTNLKNGWFEIKKEYVASANATILIVGNFSRLMNIDIMDQRDATTPTIDILVDDIAVVPMKATACAGYQRIKDSLYAIHQRHSKKLVPELNPEVSDTVPEVATNSDQNAGRPEDSAVRRPNNPLNDPLFGPEPHRKADTPKSTAPAIPPLKDTTVIHDIPPPDTIIIHNIQFDFDKYLMQNPDTLQRYRSLLTKPGVTKIEVVGYTDDAGSDAYNLDLSKKRAREVARQIAAKFDIDPTLISTDGKGISRKYPAKYLNRRVEIYIFH